MPEVMLRLSNLLGKQTELFNIIIGFMSPVTVTQSPVLIGNTATITPNATASATATATDSATANVTDSATANVTSIATQSPALIGNQV
jgi:hypothetical protein